MLYFLAYQYFVGTVQAIRTPFITNRPLGGKGDFSKMSEIAGKKGSFTLRLELT